MAEALLPMEAEEPDPYEGEEGANPFGFSASKPGSSSLAQLFGGGTQLRSYPGRAFHCGSDMAASMLPLIAWRTTLPSNIAPSANCSPRLAYTPERTCARPCPSARNTQKRSHEAAHRFGP